MTPTETNHATKERLPTEMGVNSPPYVAQSDRRESVSGGR
jgi:hypothetical protein